MEHAEKLETSLAAYLAGLDPSPWAEDLTNADSSLRIFAGESEQEKDGTCILCIVGDMTEEPPRSGNRWADVTVELRTPVQDDGGASLVNHKANAIALQTAMMATDLPDHLTSEDLGITVFGIAERNTARDQNETYWMSGFTVRAYSAPSYMT